MPLYIKNKTLHKKIYGKMEILDNKAIAAYHKGDMKIGKKYEDRSIALYAKNYSNMFGIVKRRKK